MEAYVGAKMKLYKKIFEQDMILLGREKTVTAFIKNTESQTASVRNSAHSITQ